MISTECQTFTFEKNWRSQNWFKCNSFEKPKGTRYTEGNLYFGIIIFSCLSSAKQSLRFLLICFVREIKGFYQSFLGNEVDFTDIMNVYLNVLAKKKKLKKLRHWLLDEKARITTTLTSSCHWKSLVPFCLRKKRPEKHF